MKTEGELSPQVYAGVLIFATFVIALLLCATSAPANIGEDRQPADSATILILQGNDGDTNTGAMLLLEGLTSGLKQFGKKIRIIREKLHINIAQGDDEQQQFDGKMLRRWGIGEELLPRDSIVSNREESLWDRYRWWLIGIFSVVGLQATLITCLLAALRKAQKTKKQLAESRENFRKAQEVGQLGSFIIDFHNEAVSWSEGITELLGLPATTQLSYKQFLTLVHPEDKEGFGQAWENLRSGQGGDGEFRIQVDAITKMVRVKLESELDASGTPTIMTGIIQDITAQHNATTERELLRENLIRLSRITMVEALSSKIVHEINQPLTAQRTNTEIALQLLANVHSDLAELRPIVVDILEDNRRIQSIVQGIRQMISKKAAVHVPIDLSKLILEAVRQVKASHSSLRIGTRIDLPVHALEINGDAVQLQQVFVNLLNNAYEACMLSTTSPACVTVSIRREDNSIIITVSDTGNGVDPQSAPQMFEAFFTTKNEGVGMGLAISRMIVEAHNGKIGYSANADRGLTLWVRLPNHVSRTVELPRDGDIRPLSLCDR
jgi:PAS domain S-box-containing protein